jgi:hypothetical protein
VKEYRPRRVPDRGFDGLPDGRCSDNPGNWNSASVCRQLITALAANHGIGGAATVELWSTLSQPEQRGVSGCKGDGARFLIPRKYLDRFAAGGGDCEGQWIGRELQCQASEFDSLSVCLAA